MSISIESLPDDVLRLIFDRLDSKKEVSLVCRRFRRLAAIRNFSISNEVLDDPVCRSYCLRISQIYSLSLQLSKFQPAYLTALVNAPFAANVRHLQISSNQPAEFSSVCIRALSSFTRLQTLTLSWFWQPEAISSGIAVTVEEPLSDFL